MRTLILFTTIVVISFLLAACTAGGNSETPPAAVGMIITAETNPTPAKVGDVEIILSVKDVQGNLITGAAVSVFADHTDMMGMNMTGQATEQGEGRYAIQANFSMSGNWMLKVDVKQDGQSVVQEIPLLIK